ncbi:MAG: glycosyltransferase family 4 protein, partial [Anaerolineaceae bacterium]
INCCPTILWIGRTDPIFKRPELLLEIAKQLPAYRFLMILNNTNNEYFDRIVQSKSDNVEIVEYIAPDEIDDVYRNSNILLSTSSNEGFPNIFLQAISNGIPIISLEVDPDGLFTKHECGVFCKGDINRAVEAVKILLNDRRERDRIIQRAFEYVRANHSSEVISSQMVDFFNAIPAKTTFPLRWTGISYNRVFEELQSAHERLALAHERLALDHERLALDHDSLLQNWLISKLITIRRLIRGMIQR